MIKLEITYPQQAQAKQNMFLLNIELDQDTSIEPDLDHIVTDLPNQDRGFAYTHRMSGGCKDNCMKEEEVDFTLPLSSKSRE
jgi:hypothetical protein